MYTSLHIFVSQWYNLLKYCSILDCFIALAFFSTPSTILYFLVEACSTSRAALNAALALITATSVLSSASSKLLPSSSLKISASSVII
jgi:hypothetical protein